MRLTEGQVEPSRSRASHSPCITEWTKVRGKERPELERAGVRMRSAGPFAVATRCCAAVSSRVRLRLQVSSPPKNSHVSKTTPLNYTAKKTPK
eukprot:1236677-Amphidinium_carterae.1